MTVLEGIIYLSLSWAIGFCFFEAISWVIKKLHSRFCGGGLIPRIDPNIDEFIAVLVYKDGSQQYRSWCKSRDSEVTLLDHYLERAVQRDEAVDDNDTGQELFEPDVSHPKYRGPGHPSGHRSWKQKQTNKTTGTNS